MPPKLFLDANVLYVSLLRDLILRLAVEGVCHVFWSADVQNEWKRHLVKAGYAEQVILRTQQRMNTVFPAAQVQDYEELMVQIELPDPQDHHVLAVAIQAKAQWLVTFNLKDFPAEVTELYQIQVVHPDQALIQLMEQASEGFSKALDKLIAALKAPPMTKEDIAQALAKLNMPQSATKLSK